MEDSTLFDEMSRMNNELINARRQLIRLNEQLDEKTRFLSRILQLSPNFVYVYNIHDKRIEFSNAGSRPTLDPFQRMHPDDLSSVRARVGTFDALPEGAGSSFEFRAYDEAGMVRWFLCHETVFLRDDGGRPVKLVGVAEDISEQKAREAELRRDSTVDQLTGLCNRRGFVEAVESHRGGRRRSREPFALVYFDLDHFKDINDRFGHDQGDRALIAFSSILEKSFRSSDLIARMGGDEFVVLAERADGTTGLNLLARFESQLESWNATSGFSWKLRASVGTALHDPAAPLDFDTLLKQADEAMYESKRQRASQEPAGTP